MLYIYILVCFIVPICQSGLGIHNMHVCIPVLLISYLRPVLFFVFLFLSDQIRHSFCDLSYRPGYGQILSPGLPPGIPLVRAIQVFCSRCHIDLSEQDYLVSLRFVCVCVCVYVAQSGPVGQSETIDKQLW